MPQFLLGFMLLIAAVHAWAMFFAWYYIYPWIDTPMHLAGGAWTGILFYYLAVKRFAIFASADRKRILFFGIAAVALVGIGWEFYELFLDTLVLKTYAPLNAPGELHFDTLKDLFNDLAGGAAALGAIFAMRKAGNG